MDNKCYRFSREGVSESTLISSQHLLKINRQEMVGSGAYGAVYKADFNGLTCAAKVLHRTLFPPISDDKSEKPNILQRFEEECQVLSSFRHPNIVQFLGMAHEIEEESGLPVLVMELMTTNLTRFLEQSDDPLPLHLQIDICHDTVLALAYLHSQSFIHRDLSGNNVLLEHAGSNLRAKLSDLGMSKLKQSRHELTVCPGTLVYMPPECISEHPVYTEKMDMFSFGVVCVQTATRKFPAPSSRFKELPVNSLSLRYRLNYTYTEVERRNNHISLIDPKHPLLEMLLNCLSDSVRTRPSASQTCKLIAEIKKKSVYMSSAQSDTQPYKSYPLVTQSPALKEAECNLEQAQVELLGCKTQCARLEALTARQKEQILVLRRQNESLQKSVDQERSRHKPPAVWSSLFAGWDTERRLQTELSDLRVQYQESLKSLEKAQSQLSEKDQLLASKDDEIFQKVHEKDSIRSKMDSLEVEYNIKCHLVHEKTNELKKVKRELEEKTEELTQYNVHVSELQETIIHQQKRIAELEGSSASSDSMLREILEAVNTIKGCKEVGIANKNCEPRELELQNSCGSVPSSSGSSFDQWHDLEDDVGDFTIVSSDELDFNRCAIDQQYPREQYSQEHINVDSTHEHSHVEPAQTEPLESVPKVNDIVHIQNDTSNYQNLPHKNKHRNSSLGTNNVPELCVPQPVHRKSDAEPVPVLHDVHNMTAQSNSTFKQSPQNDEVQPSSVSQRIHRNGEFPPKYQKHRNSDPPDTFNVSNTDLVSQSVHTCDVFHHVQNKNATRSDDSADHKPHQYDDAQHSLLVSHCETLSRPYEKHRNSSPSNYNVSEPIIPRPVHHVQNEIAHSNSTCERPHHQDDEVQPSSVRQHIHRNEELSPKYQKHQNSESPDTYSVSDSDVTSQPVHTSDTEPVFHHVENVNTAWSDENSNHEQPPQEYEELSRPYQKHRNSSPGTYNVSEPTIPKPVHRSETEPMLYHVQFERTAQRIDNSNPKQLSHQKRYHAVSYPSNYRMMPEVVHSNHPALSPDQPFNHPDSDLECVSSSRSLGFPAYHDLYPQRLHPQLGFSCNQYPHPDEFALFTQPPHQSLRRVSMLQHSAGYHMMQPQHNYPQEEYVAPSVFKRRRYTAPVQHQPTLYPAEVHPYRRTTHFGLYPDDRQHSNTYLGYGTDSGDTYSTSTYPSVLPHMFEGATAHADNIYASDHSTKIAFPQDQKAQLVRAMKDAERPDEYLAVLFQQQYVPDINMQWEAIFSVCPRNPSCVTPLLEFLKKRFGVSGYRVSHFGITFKEAEDSWVGLHIPTQDIRDQGYSITIDSYPCKITKKDAVVPCSTFGSKADDAYPPRRTLHIKGITEHGNQRVLQVFLELIGEGIGKCDQKFTLSSPQLSHQSSTISTMPCISDNESPKFSERKILESEPDDQQLISLIATKIPHRWNDFASFLSVPYDQIQHIQFQVDHDSHSRFKGFCEVFAYWKSHATTKTLTWNVILEALSHVDCSLANTVRTELLHSHDNV